MKALALVLALGGCAEPAVHDACGGAPALHVVVDLSQGLCPHVTDFGVTIHLAGATLTRSDALAIDGDPAHQRYAYTFAWPASVADGSAFTVDVSGSGDGQIIGAGSADDTAHVHDCQTVTAVAACRSETPDAQP